MKKKKKTGKDEEPDWQNPENDRKTPFTDEEIEYFVNDYSEQFPELVKEYLKKYDIETIKESLRCAYKDIDSNRQKLYNN